MVELLLGVKLGRRDYPATMQLNPQAIEFHTTKDDLINHFDEMKNIAKQITLPKAVHLPISVDNTPFNIDKHLYLAERCLGLGEIMVVHPDTEAGGKHDRMLDEYISSLKFFEDKNIRVAIENVSHLFDDGRIRIAHTIGNTIDDFKEIFRRWPNYGMCFDVCHAAMAGEDIKSWLKTFGRHIIHLHFSDSRNGIEGMQIGDGDIDWKNIFVWVRKYCSGRITIIPEIEDGYKNNAAGFKVALERLRKLD